MVPLKVQARLPAQLALAAVLLQGPWAGAAQVTLRGLISEMADLERLAVLPDPPYSTRQFSSYDRASKSPDQEEKLWFANGDQGHYLRVEETAGRKEYVMMDAEGPGAIVRIWSADPKGTLRIYLDGAAEPVLAAPMADLLTGKVKPFVPPIAGERSRGTNLYFPFSYQTHCKVTSDASPFYYHVNCRTYPKTTTVESFAMGKLAELQRDLDRAALALNEPQRAAPRGPTQKRAIFAPRVAPGETKQLFEIKAGGAIREIRLNLGAENSEEVLRGCVLLGVFDGEEKPSVWAPVGDFFGSAPGLNPYQSLPLGMLGGGEMYCHWVMPFEKSAVFSLVNRSSREVVARVGCQWGLFPWSDRSLRFHARWRAEHEMATRPMRDWTYLDCSGQGIFVGDALAVANPVKAWWGEGDEKIYVDGEKFPSHFGTGTEDYYGYAWSSNKTFNHAYHNQTRADGPGNSGHVSVNRWHIFDSIPFTSSFKFDMEIWHWNPTCKVSYAATSYWYSRPGGSDKGVEYAAADLRVPALPDRAAARVKDAIEGEGLKVLAKSGMADAQEMDSFEGNWSGGAQLWWREGKPGDELKLELPSPAAGRYHVLLVLTKAIDYGIHQLSINGEKAGPPVDLFNRGVVQYGPLDLGVFALKDGPNELSVKIVGTNPEARPQNYMFGLDYLLLKPE
jgi:hypothetical protein